MGVANLKLQYFSLLNTNLMINMQQVNQVDKAQRPNFNFSDCQLDLSCEG